MHHYSNMHSLNVITVRLMHAAAFIVSLIEENPLNPRNDFHRSSDFFIEAVMFHCTWSPGECGNIFKRTPALISVLDLFPQLLCSIPPSVRLRLQRTGNPIDTSRDRCSAPVIWLSCPISIMDKAGSKPRSIL